MLAPRNYLLFVYFFGKEVKCCLHFQSRYPLIVLAPAKPSHKPAVGYPLLSGLICKGSAFYKPSIPQILIAKLTIRQLKQTAIISPTTPISSVRRVKRSVSTDSLMERSLQTPPLLSFCLHIFRNIHPYFLQQFYRAK
jgi:hypothetical protein